MGKEETYRVNKTRQDQLIEEMVDRIISPESFVRDLPPEQIIDALIRLELEALRDYQEILDRREAPLDSYPDPADMWKRANHLGQCAWEHFRQNAAEKFRLSLVELVNESLGFAESIYVEHSGGSKQEIEEARPTPADIQQNVLRHSVIRLNQLPLRRESNDWQYAELGETPSQIHLQAARLIFKDLALWSYDHSSVCLLIQKMIRSYTAKHEDPDGEAKLWGDETAELMWEHIDGAVQTALLVLSTWALLLSKQSAVRRYEVEIEPGEAKQLQAPKEKLKEIANELVGIWIDGLPFEWRGRGRPAKTSAEITVEAARLLAELRSIAQTIACNGGQVTWEKLASSRNRPLVNPQSGESLRKEAAALGLRLSDIKPEEN